MQPYATNDVSLGSAEEPYDSDMTHSYRLTEGRLIRYPLTHSESDMSGNSTAKTNSPSDVMIE